LYACAKCGAVVFDRTLHQKWHWELDSLLDIEEYMNEDELPVQDSPDPWLPPIDRA
jgi:hypothetical protein